MPTEERQLLAEADRRALAYLDQTPARRVFPDAAAIAALGAFDQPLPEHGQTPEQVLTQLDEVGSPATVASNCLLYTSPSPRDGLLSRMPSSA